jgi:putative ATPase
MDLFAHSNINQVNSSPLAERLRPERRDQIIGQQEAIGPKSVIHKFLQAGRLPSLLLWGPPGTGKTTFALSLSQEIKSEFVSVNAIEIGAKGLKEIGDQAKERLKLFGITTILFVDEIHRFNKSQQDVLLPYVEKGDFTLIGATTENPSYEINRALLSRCRIIIFQRLSEDSLLALIDRGLAHYKQSSNYFSIELKQELVRIADGDGRKLLNLLESVLTGLSQSSDCKSSTDSSTHFSSVDSLQNKDQAQSKSKPQFDDHFLSPSDSDTSEFSTTLNSLNTQSSSSVQKPIEIEQVSTWLSKESLSYDKNSDQHYDIISAFIKSIRGSDSDAALYYFARMLEGGEDPLFIARRLVILASEDIGNADPKALPLAMAGFHAVEAIGLPECAINLSQVITYLATAPKSNRSYVALNEAKEFVRKAGSQEVPLSLRSSKRAAMKDLGYGENYLYPHNAVKGWVEQSYWPDQITPQKFYIPSQNGYEKHIHAFLEWLKAKI